MLLFIVHCTCLPEAKAQSSFIVGFKQAEFSIWDEGLGITETFDRGYAVSGRFDYDHFVIVRIDSNGNYLWDRQFGDVYLAYGMSIIEASDSGLAMCGFRFPSQSGDVELVVIRLDQSGDTLWTKAFAESNGIRGHSIHQSPDGGFVIGGFVHVWSNDYNGMVMKLNADGSVAWSNQYAAPMVFQGYSLEATADSGYVLVGEVDLGVYSGVGLLKIDQNGNTEWFRTYAFGLGCIGYGVKQALNLDLLITGSIRDTMPPYNTNAMLMRTSSGGNVLWTKAYSTGAHCGGKDLVVKEDGEIVVAATSSSSNYPVWIIRTDSAGNVIGSVMHPGGSSSADVGTIQHTSDGGFIMVGGSGYTPNGNITVTKMDSTGSSLCDQDSLSFSTFSRPVSSTIESITTSTAGSPISGNLSVTGGLITYDFCNGTSSVEGSLSTNLSSLLIHPNPSTGQITISGPGEGGEIICTIYNSLGELLLTQKLDDSALDVSGLRSGVYFLKANVEGTSQGVRFVKL